MCEHVYKYTHTHKKNNGKVSIMNEVRFAHDSLSVCKQRNRERITELLLFFSTLETVVKFLFILI